MERVDSDIGVSSVPEVPEVASFDPVWERLRDATLSFTEAEALETSHWESGEDARLWEDWRFRPTPWGRWIPSAKLLANELLFERLRAGESPTLPLAPTLEALGPCWCLCPGDDRLVLERASEELRLSSRFLSEAPFVVDDIASGRFETHLPVFTLEAAAAAVGQWGLGAEERLIEIEGWLQVELARPLNSDMFVARIVGHSMDGGKQALCDGDHAVFEFDRGGTRQGQIVLVQGNFNAPDTGNYAVKLYNADARGGDGTHRQIRLISTNPDKDTYPDLELDPTQDNDVVVVARLIQRLDARDFARLPRPPQVVGRRNLSSPVAVEARQERLARQVEAFFERDAEVTSSLDEGDEPEDETLSRLCIEEGRLHLHVQPITGLPRFLKKLAIRSGDWQKVVLVANHRQRAERISIPIDAGPISWHPVGFEDDLEDFAEELDKLALDGLPTDTASPFREDCWGVAWPLASRSLSAGQRYHVVLPPGLGDPHALGELHSQPESGWRIWSFTPPRTPSPSWLSALGQLDLDLGLPALDVAWVAVPPVAFRQTPRGDRYPCFAATPILAITGPAVAEGELAVLLVGASDTRELFQLPPGRAWHLELQGLDPGRYALEVVPTDTSRPTRREMFEIVARDNAFLARPSTAALSWGSSRWDLQGQRVIRSLSEIEEARENPCSVTLELPPCWPLDVTWLGNTRLRLDNTNADDEGHVDLAATLGSVSTLARELRYAELHLNARELGHLHLALDLKPAEEALEAQLAELFKYIAPQLRQRRGHLGLLATRWLEPLCKLLGYQVAFDPVEPDAPLAHFTCATLYEEQRNEAGIALEPSRLLVATSTIEGATPLGEALDHAREQRAARDLDVAFVTDGFRWTLISGRRRVPPPINLEHIMATRDSDALLDFLARFEAD